MASLDANVLTVVGTKRSDEIVVAVDANDATHLLVTINGHAVGGPFTLADVTGILVKGGNGNDKITIENTLDIPATLMGGNGKDVLNGGMAGDDLLGGNGKDGMSGGLGDDNLAGGNGRDNLHGGDGDDVQSGGKGHAYLNGDADSDTLTGGTGDDTMDGGEGEDSITGGNGDDVFEAGETDTEVHDQTDDDDVNEQNDEVLG
jgi:Ca2+-binding RTX toxin-like protein